MGTKKGIGLIASLMMGTKKGIGLIASLMMGTSGENHQQKVDFCCTFAVAFGKRIALTNDPVVVRATAASALSSSSRSSRMVTRKNRTRVFCFPEAEHTKSSLIPARSANINY